MNTVTKVRRENGYKIVSTLILSGASLMGTCAVYEPAPAIRTKGIEKVYIQNNRYNPYKSEERKKELLAQIAEVRRQMREVVITNRYYKNENMKVQPPVSKVREALTSLNNINKLTDSIFS